MECVEAPNVNVGCVGYVGYVSVWLQGSPSHNSPERAQARLITQLLDITLLDDDQTSIHLTKDGSTYLILWLHVSPLDKLLQLYSFIVIVANKSRDTTTYGTAIGIHTATCAMGDGIVEKATVAIEAANLTPTEHLILLNFVREAYEPSLAAQEVLDRIRGNDKPVEEILRVLKEEWHDLVAVISRTTPFDASLRDLVNRRDRSRCLVTPSSREQLDAPEPTFIIPPALTELVGGNGIEHPSRSLLDAFMTPPRTARLLSMVSDTSNPGRLANALLFTPSVLRAFQNGHVQVRRHLAKSWDDIDEDAGQDEREAGYFMMPIYPEKYGDIVLADRTLFNAHSIALKTEDPKQIPLPSPFLLKTHNKFANALHQFYVEERIAEGWGSLQSPSFFSRSTQSIARTIWLLVPKFIRVTCYHYLIQRGKSKYGLDSSEAVQQLPFGLYAKCDFVHSNEPSALRLLEREAPSIPAPLLIDTFEQESTKWFISTRVPGTRVHGLLHRMSYPERDQLAADISHIIAQMHKIPNRTPYRFANVTGGPIYDRRIDFKGVGPFNNEADLNTALAGGSRLQESLMAQVPGAFSRSHDSVFTHGDLYFGNLLVDGGRLSGVVDWESAAFMPTYWECAKATRTEHSEEAKSIYKRVWGDEFDVELEAEMWLWDAFPIGGGGFDF
ncbi:hypothetical protein V494_05322 [Pseudogymnoascus sp. VKM F-4513 (FW-928)]|nr:hypothetical protein V494_05322 [Pseudogymnoascus sp. VKM F-4513 (FW-928)]